MESFERYRTEDVIDGVGLTIGEMQSIARRQLVGSTVAIIFISAAVGLVALRPSRQAIGEATAQDFRHLQQPSFLAPSDRVIATIKGRIEAP